MKKPIEPLPDDPGGWNAWLIIVVIGAALMQIVQAITWPFRVVYRWLKSLFS